MTQLVKGLFGSSSQDKLIRRQQADQRAVEAGQKRLREGGRGLLSFIDEDLGGLLGGSKPRGLLSMLGGG